MKAANIRGLKISGPALVQETLSVMMVVIMRNHLDMSSPTPELDRLRFNLDAIRTPCVLSYTPLRTIIKIICSIFSWVLYEQK